MSINTAVGTALGTSRRQLLVSSLPAFALAGLLTDEALGVRPPPPEPPEAVAADLFRSMFAGEKYTLPPLPYAYDALEPHIDAQTMELHHSKHHNAYVTNLNKALDELKGLKGTDADPHTVECLQRDISFNAGGHVMHTLFWSVMAPDAGGEPQGLAGELIAKTFGDYANFKAYFVKVAMSVKGSGWAVLGYEPFGGQLLTFAMGDQDTRLAAGTIPVLAVDVWEHAYYLKYQNRRADYLAAWFNTINWPVVDAMVKAHQHPLGNKPGAA